MTTPTNIPIDTIVTVNITKQTVVPSLIDFGLMNLISEDIEVIPPEERYRIYNSFAEVMADFDDTTPEYTYAITFFAQSPRPQRLMITVVDTAEETYAEAIQAAYDIQNFYGVALANLALTNSDILAIAAYIQTKIMVLSYQTSAADVLTNVTTDIASLLKQANRNRVGVCYYDPDYIDSRFDGAFFGYGLTQDTGTFNWANKSLNGIIPTAATLQQINFALAKGVNFYMRAGGVPITRLGNVSGESSGIIYLDEITGIDWLTINIQQQVFQLLASSPKVPYTDSGLASIAGVIENVLQVGIDRGILAETPAPSVTYLAVADVPDSERQARRAPTCNFTARLAGAVNYITINGILTV
jgi:hypothetical protein